jgi:hypothetical protein
MTTEPELRGLYDRVTAATGPDRDLDWALHELIQPWYACHKWPTERMDSAAALIARIYPGASWTLSHYGADDLRIWETVVSCRIEGKSRNEHGATHALAMIAALLWAMMEEAKR